MGIFGIDNCRERKKVFNSNRDLYPFIAEHKNGTFKHPKCVGQAIITKTQEKTQLPQKFWGEKYKYKTLTVLATGQP